MALTITIDGVDRAYAVRLVGANTAGEGFHTEAVAMSGIVASGLIEVEDDDGSLDLRGWRGAYIIEDTATPDRIWTGFIANVDQTAGPFRTGPGRVHRCETVDLNWNLTRKAIETGGKRPAETDLQRVTWLLGHETLTGLVYTGDLTDLTNNAVNLGDADYTDQYPIDVLTDICPVSGKTAYVTWDYDNDRPQLFYDLTTTTTYDSPASISDVLADSLANPTTVFPPRIDPVLHRVIEDAYSDVWLRYQKGIVHKHDATFETDHARRDLVLSTSRIGSAATADAYATKALNAHNHETDSIDCEVELEASHVNDILEGHRLYFKSSHLTGFTSFAYTRVERRTVRQVDDQSRRFIVGLQLSDRILSALPGGPPPSVFPKPPPSTPAIVQFVSGSTDGSGNLTLPDDPVVGDTLVCFTARRAGAPDIPSGEGWVEHSHGSITPGSDGARMYYRPVVVGDTATVQVVSIAGGRGYLWEITGTPLLDSESNTDVDTSTKPATASPGTLTPTSGISVLVLGGICVHCSDWGGNDDFTVSDPTDWTRDGKHEVNDVADSTEPDIADTSHPLSWAGHRTIAVTSGSYTPTLALTGAGNNFGGHGGLAMAFAGDAADNPPAPGQLVPWTEVTMSTVGGVSTGTTAFPYADGTLQVKVQSQEILPANFTETDGATGDFALSWEIDADEHVYVQYLGR